MAEMTAEVLCAMPPDGMRLAMKKWNKQTAGLRDADWHFWRRDAQKPPPGDWRVWLVMAGRGFGKTRMGAEWINEIAWGNPGARLALIGATLVDPRDPARMLLTCEEKR